MEQKPTRTIPVSWRNWSQPAEILEEKSSVYFNSDISLSVNNADDKKGMVLDK